MPKISLGIYVGRYTSNTHAPDVAAILLDMERKGILSDKHPFLWATSCRVDSNRNFIISDFLHKTTSDYLLIVDEDMLHPPMLGELLLSDDKEIVSALYFRRDYNEKYYPVAYKHNGRSVEGRRGHGTFENDDFRHMGPEVLNFFHEVKNVPNTDGPVILRQEDNAPYTNSLIRMDGGGFGAVMLRRDALEKMDEPYLLSEPGLNGDLVFYRNAMNKGIEVWLDMGVICGHSLDQHISIRHFVEFTWSVKAAKVAEMEKEIDRKKAAYA